MVRAYMARVLCGALHIPTSDTSRGLCGRTFFMDDSVKAYEDNYIVQHMVAFCFLLRRRYPHVLLSMENPATEHVAPGLDSHLEH